MKIFLFYLFSIILLIIYVDYTFNLDTPGRTNPIYKMKSYYGSYFLGDIYIINKIAKNTN